MLRRVLLAISKCTFLSSLDVETDDNLVGQLNNIYVHYDAPSMQSYQLEITLLHSICVEKSRYDEHRLGCHRYRRLLRVGPFLFKLLSTSKHFQIRGPSSRCRVPASKGRGKGLTTSMLKRAYSVGKYCPKNVINFYWTQSGHCLALSDCKSLLTKTETCIEHFLVLGGMGGQKLFGQCQWKQHI